MGIIKKIENVTGKRKNKTTKIMSIAPPEIQFVLIYFSFPIYYIKLDRKPDTKSNPASISTTKIITISIQIANFKRYQPMIAARIITAIRIAHERSIKAKIILSHHFFIV